jgi:hypothetical protein
LNINREGTQIMEPEQTVVPGAEQHVAAATAPKPKRVRKPSKALLAAEEAGRLAGYREAMERDRSPDMLGISILAAICLVAGSIAGWMGRAMWGG